jgi:predicted MPP superfamily phosphohydrolase
VESPDYILMPGDIFERLDIVGGEAYDRALMLLSEASKIAPTYYSCGNHEDGAIRSWSMRWKNKSGERKYSKKAIDDINESGVIFLENSFVLKNGMAIGGLASGLLNEGSVPELSWLDEFCKIDAPKVLLCHHPEYYKKYLRDLDIDIVVSGHAHGGQWRAFGRGIFAPGQGLFPKYTKGVYDNKLVVGTGLKKGRIPRFFNPTEVVIINIV